MTAAPLTAARPLRCWVPQGVYAPQADTRLLGRALCRERITEKTDVLEPSTGSGLLAVAATRLGGRVTADCWPSALPWRTVS
ncbi:hypothetical protein AB0M32_31400 [Streptomyces sp. NPDC051985]|uniref:hypothetical protein n=1 Tax=Streptomyces sp. NPDC051985 TaxID=3155807 RepID=UPI00342009D4